MEGLRVLDIGCGGGLLSEPVARMGADVVGADPSEKNIGIASTHARENNVPVDYRAVTAEQLQQAGETLRCHSQHGSGGTRGRRRPVCGDLRKDGATRRADVCRHHQPHAESPRACDFAAENVLRWLPRGTHQYEKLVRPDELEKPMLADGMEIIHRTGVFYNLLQDRWNLSPDMEVNYMVAGQTPGLSAAGDTSVDVIRQHRKGCDLDTLLNQRPGFLRACLAYDATLFRFAIMDLPGLLPGFVADILSIGTDGGKRFP